MNKKEILENAQRLKSQNDKIRNKPKVKDAMAWLDYVGLLRNNQNLSYKVEVCLEDLLQAAVIEPRIYELLPAIIIELKGYVEFKKIPNNLKQVISAIEENSGYIKYHYAKPADYLQWLQGPAIELAKKRLNPRSKPRINSNKGELASLIKAERQAMGFTQKLFAKRFKVSLRVLRDLEQGSQNVSILRANKILNVFNKKIDVAVNNVISS